MIWMNLNKLETQLAQNEVTNQTSHQYLFVYLVFFVVAFKLLDSREFTHFGLGAWGNNLVFRFP